MSPFTQDLIVVPCNTNPTHSEHWFLLAALPKKKIYLVIVLDSLAGDIVKPTTHNALNKMGSVLLNVDPSCNLEKWNFIYNFKHNIPQQDNGDDCGVYTCLYARCLAGLGPMVQESSFPQLQQCMLFSLHRGILHKIPLPEIEVEKYYALDYLNKYYVHWKSTQHFKSLCHFQVFAQSVWSVCLARKGWHWWCAFILCFLWSSHSSNIPFCSFWQCAAWYWQAIQCHSLIWHYTWLSITLLF